MLISVLKRVFSNWKYFLVALAIAFTLLSVVLLLPNLTFIKQVVSSDHVSLIQKITSVLPIYGSIFTNYSWFSGLYLVVVSTLFGVNIALLTFYIRRRKSSTRQTKIHLSSAGGTIAAVLGIGCAACGSVVLTAVVGLAVSGWILSILPLRGLEFGLVGMTLLGLSVYYLSKKINDPLVCSYKS